MRLYGVSPDGANARGAFDCCMVENSGVSCREKSKFYFVGQAESPGGANARGAFD